MPPLGGWCPDSGLLKSLQCNGDPDGMLGDGTEQCRVEQSCSSREAEIRQYIARHSGAGHPIDLQCDVFIFLEIDTISSSDFIIDQSINHCITIRFNDSGHIFELSLSFLKSTDGDGGENKSKKYLEINAFNSQFLSEKQIVAIVPGKNNGFSDPTYSQVGGTIHQQ